MSQAFTLSKVDLKKIGKGLLIALSAAVLTYLADIIPQVDFGSYTPLVVASFSTLINICWKFIRTN